MHMRAALRLFVAGLAFVPLAPVRAADCATMLHLHGYLTVAHAKCGLKEAPEVVDEASACRTQLGAAAATQMATDGIRFGEGELVEKGGVAAWCAFVKGKYPSLISGKARPH